MTESYDNEILFDATERDPNPKFEPIPKGIYKVVLKDWDKKETRQKTGEYLSLTFEILEGEYKGRSLWENLNLWNKSKMAVDIAEQALTQICHSVGQLKIRSYNDLLNRPLLAHVVLRAATDNYKESNEIKMFSPLSEGRLKSPSYHNVKVDNPIEKLSVSQDPFI